MNDERQQSKSGSDMLIAHLLLGVDVCWWELVLFQFSRVILAL